MRRSARPTISESGTVVRRIHAHLDTALAVVDAAGWDMRTLHHHMEEEARRLLISRATCRAFISIRGLGGTTLLFNLHHICADARSIAIYLDEFGSLIYRRVTGGCGFCARRLPHFVSLEQDYLNGEGADRAWSYWQDELSGLTPLELPLTARARSAARRRMQRFVLDAGIASGIKDLAQRNGVTGRHTAVRLPDVTAPL